MQQTGWFNFKTGEYDFLTGGPSDEKAKEYISQEPAAQMLYECRIGLGDTPLEAMEQVLRACVPG